MHSKTKIRLIITAVLGIMFILWTIAVKSVDCRAIGPEGSEVGFAGINGSFHELTGVHMGLYDLTDALSVIPIGICVIFGGMGFFQLIKRKSLLKVDRDIIVLGIFYTAVIAAYFIFEKIALNFRPVLIEGVLEASYPSSTTLLTLCVMLTAITVSRRHIKNSAVSGVISVLSGVFAAFMVISRTVSGVHWLTDIIGGIILSGFLIMMFRTAVFDGDDI